MSSNNDNCRMPRLRFPEFEGEWEEKKLGEIGVVYQGFGFPNEYQGVKRGDLPFCKVSDISETADRGSKYINSAKNYVNYSLLPKLHAQPIPIGSTIFAKIGEAIRLNKRVITSVLCLIDNNTAAIKANCRVTDDFLFYLMSIIDLAVYSGGVVPSVKKTSIEAVPILSPSLLEQQKIASCLSVLDDVINSASAKLEALKDHKKSLMQQLFPQNGETTPRLRFPGFEGEWEEKKLGEVGRKVNRKNKNLAISRVLTNSANEGVVDQCDYFDRDIAIKANTDNYNVVGLNEFVYNPRISANAPVGPISVNKLGEGIMSPLYTIFKIEQGYIPFFEQYFQTKIWHLYLKNVANFGARFDRMNITVEAFFNMPLYVPSLAEQEKIASCLSALDDVINSASEKLEALKDHKKGLMQQLFPQPSSR